MQPLFAIAIIALITGLAVMTIARRSGSGGPSRKTVALGGLALAAIAGAALASPALLFWACMTGVSVALFRHFRGVVAQPPGASGAPGRSSVRTPWLEAWLDHDTGAMDGTVLKGRWQGQALDNLSLDALRDLMEEASDDADTQRLVEAYLDRRFEDWRSTPHGARNTGTDAQGNTAPLTMDRALAILGLPAGAGRQDVIEAHRRLMQHLHPDRGGSDYLAAEVNQAKDWLMTHLPP